MKDLYNTNKDFEDYVDRYCKNRHILIRLVGQHYKELEESRDEVEQKLRKE